MPLAAKNGPAASSWCHSRCFMFHIHAVYHRRLHPLVISSFPNQTYQQFMSQAFGESWSAIIEIPFNAVFFDHVAVYQLRRLSPG